MITRYSAESRKPRALVLTFYYSPEPNFITKDVARGLSETACVTVITTHPNFPAGKFYSGFKYWRPVRSVEEGVTVWRLPHLPDRSTSTIRRALSYLSFAVAAALMAPFVAGRPAVVWVYHTPFTTALAGLFFKFAYKSRLVLTTVDLWPENFQALDLVSSGRMIRWLYRYRKFINRLADANICCSRSAVERYIEDGLPAEDVVHLPVWVEGIPAQLPAHSKAAQNRNIVYAGTLGPSQPIDVVVRSAAQLHKEGVDVSFDIFGTGVNEPELRSLAAELGATNVRFHGRVAPEVAFEKSAAAFAQIISIRSTPLFRMVIPSKIYLAFAAGAPILGGVDGESAELIKESAGGLIYEAESVESLSQAVRDLLELNDEERLAMSSKLQSYYEENFRREKILSGYMGVLFGKNPRRAVERTPGAGALANDRKIAAERSRG